MERVKELEQRAQSGVPVHHHYGNIVSMQPRVSISLAFRENTVCSGENGLGYQRGVELFG